MISLIISTLVVLVIPKLIGVEEYGYWQLYILYTSYVGFLHFGWNDGIYLRYGGKDYNELDKKLFFSQFYMLLIMQIVIAIIITLVTYFLISDGNRIFILRATSIDIVIVNTRYMLLFILQATNQIKKYAKVIILDRIIYVGLIVLFLLIGQRNYKLMIITDLISKGISFLYVMYLCRDIVFQKFSEFIITISETITNISVGIKLLFSNIASKFVIGCVKLGIERSWDISTFGKVSLTLSVSNFVMIFISAIGIIMYPILRRTNEEKLPSIYRTMRELLIFFILATLIIYYPLKVILSRWLPEYAESLNYMGILFPIVIFESKMSLLVNTYLKALRKEKHILIVNVITVFMSIVLTIIASVMLKNLNFAVSTIVILLAIKSIIAEIFLSKIININIYKDIVLEIIMIIVFIYSSWIVNSSLSTVFYGMAYLLYVFIKRSDIKAAFKTIGSLVKA